MRLHFAITGDGEKGCLHFPKANIKLLWVVGYNVPTWWQSSIIFFSQCFLRWMDLFGAGGDAMNASSTSLIISVNIWPLSLYGRCIPLYCTQYEWWMTFRGYLEVYSVTIVTTLAYCHSLRVCFRGAWDAETSLPYVLTKMIFPDVNKWPSKSLLETPKRFIRLWFGSLCFLLNWHGIFCFRRGVST